jgi:glycerol-3-phosphate acyltransferase PlsY
MATNPGSDVAAIRTGGHNTAGNFLSVFPSTETEMFWRLIAVLVACYLLGCFVAAYYVTRWRRGVDIRASGSGNAGARNMARVYGMTDAVITLVLDATKGAIAVVAGLAFIGPEWAGLAALLAAIIGHIWPIQLSFHGGKGVATGLGGILFLNPVVALALLAAGAMWFAFSRDFFRSGLVAIAFTAPMLWLFGHDMPTIAVALVTSAICLAVNHPILDARRQPRTG